MEEQVRLGKLKKYVPFMDWIIESNHIYKDKFSKMRRWIITNKKYGKEYFHKLEKSIIVTYKDLNTNEKFPQELHNLFTIDLCSDDEKETPPPESKSVPSEQPSAIVTISEDEDITTSDSKHTKLTKDSVDPNVDIVDQTNSKPDVICKEDKMPKDVDKKDVSQNFSADNNDTSIFKRRNDFINSKAETTLHSANGKKNKKKRYQKKLKSELKEIVVIDNITLTSSSEDEGKTTSNTEKSQPLMEVCKLNPLSKNKADEIRKTVLSSDILDAVDISELRRISKSIDNTAGIVDAPETSNSVSLLKCTTNVSDDKNPKFSNSIQKTTNIPKDGNNSARTHSMKNHSNKTNTVPTQTTTVFKNGYTTPNVVIPNISGSSTMGNSVPFPNQDLGFGYHSAYNRPHPVPNYPPNFIQMQQQYSRPPPLMSLTIVRPTLDQPLLNTTLLPAPPAPVPPIYGNTASPDLVKDPRLRKLYTEGQYGYNRKPAEPSVTQVTSLSVQQQPTRTPTYGQYTKEKRQMEEQRKLLEKEELRLVQERKRKERKKLEQLRQTENVKQILYNYKDEITKILKKDLNSEKNNTTAIEGTQPAVEDKPPQNSTAAVVTSQPNKEMKNKESNEINSTNKSTINKAQERVLKVLECTFIGYRSMQDFLPKTIEGKRRCSISARKAIAVQLNGNSEEFTTKKRRISESFISTKTTSSLDEVTCKRRRIEEQIFDLKPCYVKLVRLPAAAIAKYNRNLLQSPALIERFQTKQYAHKTTENKNNFHNVKNTDCGMTERNCIKCAICARRTTNFTSHFINFHKSESYISRLTWEELDDLLIKVPFAEEVTSADGNAPQQYKIDCPFCPEGKKDITETFGNLRRHFSTHTGEYSYQCKNCSLLQPFKQGIQSHQKRTKCRKSGIKTMYQYPAGSMVIYMYVCSICNFVQLNKENVNKHLREQHGKPQVIVSQFVKEYTLAAIKDGLIERVQLNTLPELLSPWEDQSETGFPPLNENVVVGNEPVLDDSVDIKPAPSIVESNVFVWETPTQLRCPSIFENSKTFTVVHGYTPNNEANMDIKTEIDTAEDIPLRESQTDPEVNEPVSDCVSNQPEIELPILDVKPNPEHLATESAKALLHKITSKTGVRPDLLYQCPIHDCGGFFSNFHLWSKHMTSSHNAILATCSHCLPKGCNKPELEMTISDFDEHFNTHCMHSYVCFHCAFTSVDEQKATEHASSTHPEFPVIRIERIPFNITYSYYVVIGEEVLTERLDFLIELSNVLKKRLQQLEDEENISMWPLKENPSWIEELSIPVYKQNVISNVCYLSKCKQIFENPKDLLHHLETKHNDRKDLRFVCRLCKHVSTSLNWIELVKHNYLHSEKIYICCCCLFFTYDREVLSEHIRSKHDKRDVGVVSLLRSADGIKAEVAFVFPTGSKTFNTSSICCCGCGDNNLSVGKYVSHLRREHLLNLRYYCEHCNERLPQLQLCDDHFRVKHGDLDKPLKVRCQIACNKKSQISIVSINPIQLQLSDENYLQSNRNRLPSIKNEILEEDEPIFMEEDEVVAECEAAKVTTNNNHKPQISIICARTLKLLD